MDISQILSLNCVSCAIEATSKKRILESISEFASAQVPSLSADLIFSSLVGREKVGSTGIGNGIAIPHGRMPNIDRVYGFLITCNPAVDYDSIDDKPVDVLFTLLVPEEQAEGHLQTLAMIASKLSDKQILKAIRQASTNELLYEAIT